MAPQKFDPVAAGLWLLVLVVYGIVGYELWRWLA